MVQVRRAANQPTAQACGGGGRIGRNSCETLTFRRVTLARTQNAETPTERDATIVTETYDCSRAAFFGLLAHIGRKLGNNRGELMYGLCADIWVMPTSLEKP